MIRRAFYLVAVALCCAPVAFAQDEFSRVEVFGGYSYLRADLSDDQFAITEDNESLHGFHAQVAGNFNRHFGIAGDLSGHYKNLDTSNFFGIPEVRLRSAKASVYTFLGGPQVKARNDRATLFAHALFGAARVNLKVVVEDIIPGNNFGGTFTESETKFAFALGGGVDVNVSDRIAIRAVQADYLRTRFGNQTQNNLRLSVGVVFK